MPVVHAESGTVLATDVETADSWFASLRGLRFRSELPEDEALVFSFESVRRRDVDMLFVPFPIDVLWLIEGRVGRVETLRPWLGFGLAQADTLVELPAGAAADVAEGDAIEVRL